MENVKTKKWKKLKETKAKRNILEQFYVDFL